MTDYFNVLAELQCRHVTKLMSGRYQPGDEVFCRKCNALTTVVSLPSEYAYKCRDCRAGRQYGAGKFAALRGRDRHLRRYPEHTVRLLLGGKVLDEVQGKTVMQLLPFDVEKPPF